MCCNSGNLCGHGDAAVSHTTRKAADIPRTWRFLCITRQMWWAVLRRVARQHGYGIHDWDNMTIWQHVWCYWSHARSPRPMITAVVAERRHFGIYQKVKNIPWWKAYTRAVFTGVSLHREKARIRGHEWARPESKTVSEIVKSAAII